VLQCVAVCLEWRVSNLWESAAAFCSVLQCMTVCCRAVQCVMSASA